MKSLSRGSIYYSVDVYRSLLDSQYIGVSSFVIRDREGELGKPAVIGDTPQKAADAVGPAIERLTGRKSLILMAVHMHLDRWTCLKCGARVTFESKEYLRNHDRAQHPALPEKADKGTEPLGAQTPIFNPFKWMTGTP